MKTTKEMTAKQALREANKECRTLAGACKICAKFWKYGYKQAFAEFGITFEKITDLKVIINLCQQNEQKEIYLTKLVRVLDANKQPVKTADGKYKKVSADVVVKNWSPNILFKVLEQSMNK